MKPVLVRRRAGFAWQMPHARAELEKILRAMRSACGLHETPLDVTLADDAFLAEVNAAYLSCPGPTNIISFPPRGGSGPGAAPGAGIMLLSLDALNREALLYGRDAAEYALRLFAHGMAHLTGLDHGPEMDALEDAAFAAGGFVIKQDAARSAASGG